MDADRQVPDDLGSDYVANTASRQKTSDVAEMEQFLSQAQQPQSAPTADVMVGGQRVRPLPEMKPLVKQTTDQVGRIPTAPSDIKGSIMRNAAEVPGAAAGGVESAIEHSFGWAIDPLANWLNTHVADLSYTRDAPRTPTGAITKNLSEFLTGFIPALKGLRAIGMTSNVAAPVVAGAISSFLTQDPHEGRLSDLWAQANLPKNVLTDYLSHPVGPDQKEGEVEGRFKNAVESAFTGLGAEGVVMAARALRAARNVRGVAMDETAYLKGKYGEVTDADINAKIGDPKLPVVEHGPSSELDAKIAQGAADTENLAPRSLVRSTKRAAPPVLDVPPETPRTTDPDAAKARIKDLQSQAKVLADKGDLTGEEAQRFQEIMGEIHSNRFEVAKPLSPDNVKPEMSTLSPEVTATAYNDTIRNKDVHAAVMEASDGVKFNADTAIDKIMVGDGKITPPQLYNAYSATREAIRKQFGDTITLYRAVGEQKPKATTNWATTEDFAKQFGGNVVKKEFPVDNIIAANVSRNGKYHELVMGTPPEAAKPAAAVKPGIQSGDFSTYINFAKIDEPDQVKFVLGKMAEAAQGTIDEAKRGVITNQETQKLADNLGMSVEDLLARQKGQPFNAEQAVAARQLWAASAERLLETAKVAASANAGPLDQFAFRKMMATHAAIQSEIIGARTETARALQSWQIPVKGDIARARAIDQIMGASGGQDVSQEMAKRLAILGAEGADPATIARFAQKGYGAASIDAIKEVWINGLLSNPKTHLVNIMSNTLVAAAAVAERQVAGTIRALTGGDGVEMGEAAAQVFGLVSGIKDSFRLAAKALRTGETGWTLNKVDIPQHSALSANAFGIANDTGLGKAVDFIGNAARVPSRLLGAEDEFFKSIGYRMEIHAQAVRQAVQEGNTGYALGKRVAELIQNPPENIMINSADMALYNTFTNQTGPFAQAMMNLRNSGGSLNPIMFVLPFIRTPANIARFAMERTPFAPLVSQWRADIAAGGARSDLALARMSTGTAIMLSTMDLADKGLITGPMHAGTKDQSTSEALQRQGVTPYSFNVGGKWYSYNRADPFGMTMGFAASINEAVKKGELDHDQVDEWQEVAAMAIAAVSQVVINKTYMQGLAQFIDAMSDPPRYSPKEIENISSSMIPLASLSAGVKNMVDPTQREVNSPWEAIQAKIAGLSKDLTPRRDLWGKPIDYSSGLGSVYDFLSPIGVKKQDATPIDREIVRLGEGPQRITKQTSFDGVQANLRFYPKVYDDYQRLAGNDLKSPAWGMGAKDYLNAVVSGQHPMSSVYNLMPDESRKAFISSTVQDFRKQAQQQILGDPKNAAFAQEIQRLKEIQQAQHMPVVQ